MSKIEFTRRALGAALLLAPGAALAADEGPIIAAARREGRLNVASAAPGEGFPKFLQAFRTRYPFLDVSTGLYVAPTGQVLARVNAEINAASDTFDAMLAANMAAFVSMTAAGRLMRYDSSQYAKFPPMSYQPGYWGAAQAIGVIMAYNKNNLAPAAAPKSWVDLLKPSLKGGKIAIQNQASGTTFNQMYMLEKVLGLEFLKKFAAQKPVIMATSAQVSDAVIRGEVLVGATLDHWRAFEPSAIAAGVLPVYPTEGMPLALAPVGIVKGAPHPNAARLFMDFILSQAGQTLLDTRLYGMYSMRPDVPAPPGQRPLAETKPLLPSDLADYQRASAVFPQHFDSIFRAAG